MEKILFRILPWYLIGANVMALSLCGWDKSLARRRKRRISERTLLLTAALGGAAGMLLGMRLFRHKTRHKKFTVLVPVFLCLQALAVVLLILMRGTL